MDWFTLYITSEMLSSQHRKHGVSHVIIVNISSCVCPSACPGSSMVSSPEPKGSWNHPFFSAKFCQNTSNTVVGRYCFQRVWKAVGFRQNLEKSMRYLKIQIFTMSIGAVFFCHEINEKSWHESSGLPILISHLRPARSSWQEKNMKKK